MKVFGEVPGWPDFCLAMFRWRTSPDTKHTPPHTNSSASNSPEVAI